MLAEDALDQLGSRSSFWMAASGLSAEGTGPDKALIRKGRDTKILRSVSPVGVHGAVYDSFRWSGRSVGAYHRIDQSDPARRRPTLHLGSQLGLDSLLKTPNCDEMARSRTTRSDPRHDKNTGTQVTETFCGACWGRTMGWQGASSFMQTRSSIGCGARSKFWGPNLPKERTALAQPCLATPPALPHQ